MAQRFTLDLLQISWNTLGARYDYPRFWSALLACGAPVGLTISLDEIEVYDWDEQAIHLTPAASLALSQAPSRLFQRFGLPLGLDTRAFLVSLDGQPQYGGIFLHRISAMGIDFPVIYIEPDGDKVVLLVRPRHIIFGEHRGLPASVRAVVERPAIRQALMEAGKLP